MRPAAVLQSAGSSSPSSGQPIQPRFRDWQEHWLFRYAQAVLAVALGVLLHYVLTLVGLKLIYVTFYAAIIVSALLGGLGPGLLATLLAALWADYYVLKPTGSFHVRSPGDLIGLAVFSATGVFFSVLGQWSIKARRTYQDSAKELADAQRVAGVGSWQWIVATDTVTWSEEIYRIRGIDPRQRPPGFEKLQNYYTQESWARLRAAVKRALQTGDPYELELELVRQDGSTRWVVGRGECERDARGQVVRLRGTLHDITARKRGETELLALKDQLAAELTAMTRLHQLSTRLLATTELQPLLEEVLSATIALQNADFGNVQLYNPETQALEIVAHQGLGAEFLQHFSNVRAGSGTCGQALHLRQRVIVEDVETDAGYDGLRDIVAATGYRAVQSTPLFTGKGEPLGMISTHFRQPHRPSDRELSLTDLYARQAAEMIERKRAEGKLREQAAMLNLAHDAIIMTDLNFRILFWNHGAEETYGFSSAEALGQATHRLLETEFPQPITKLLDQVQTTGSWTGELKHTRRDGIRIVVGSRWSMQRDEQGAPIALLQVNRDVTEHKQLETQLVESQKLEAIGRLAGGLAHDFNNIMSIILGYTDTAREKLAPGSPLEKEITGIYTAAERASGLTRQLLAFSRKQVLETRILNLNDVIGELNVMWRRLIGENIELIFRPSPELGAVKADPAQMQQVLMNLAVNARDAMPMGGRLVITTSNIRLHEDYCRYHPAVPPGEYVMISVEDTGSGMDEATSARIFEPFFTTKGLGKGTGLGLSIIYGIVRQSGGDIEVTSAPGKGTIFRIYLPHVAGQSVPLVPAEPARSAGQASETIMLVEDEAALVEMIRDVLESGGYSVLEAASGEEALRLERGYGGEIHMLLTDVVLKTGMDGTALASRMQKLRPGIKVMYMSGYNELLEALDGQMIGDILLQKPFTTLALRTKVRELLDRATSRVATTSR
jgi:PAS domain S-box-containing protein